MYTKKIWDEWLAKESKNYSTFSDPSTGLSKRKYLKKGYLHFDSRYWLPTLKDDFQKFISNSSNLESRAFYPFLKIVHKTPRFRFDPMTKKRVVDFKPRPICYASHFDALIYSFCSHYLTKIYEDFIHKYEIDEVVLAYRTDLNKCNIDFSKEIFDYVEANGACTAIALDVKGFFDNLDHQILKAKWIKVLDQGLTELPTEQFKVFKSLTTFSYVNKNTILSDLNLKLANLSTQPKSILELVPGTRDFEKFRYLRSRNIIATNIKPFGIPQGSPMSAVLSNIYMVDFDRDMIAVAKDFGCLYRRYCDDILFVCPTENASRIKLEAYNKIADYKLSIQKKKEEEILFQENSKGEFRAFDAKKLSLATNPINELNEQKYYKPLQYLGFEYNGKNILIRSSSTSRYFRKMKARVDKTIKMAYSQYGKGGRIMKRKLLHRYTHLGKRNFISYALNSSKLSYRVSSGVMKTGLGSQAIRRQVSSHYSKLMKDLTRKNNARIGLKSYKGKLNKVKIV